MGSEIRIADTQEEALKAANRIMHMDYPGNLSRDELIRWFTEDAQLVAGVLIGNAAAKT